jgi:hypothetical protein
MAQPPKLDESQRREIVRRHTSGESLRTIAAAYGVSHIAIKRCVDRAKAAQGVAPAPGSRDYRPSVPGGPPRVLVDLAHHVAAAAPPRGAPPADIIEELDDYDRRRWALVARLDDAMLDCRPSDLANLAKTQNTILMALQNASVMRKSTGDTTDGLGDIAAGVRARLRRLAEAGAAAVEAAPVEVASTDTSTGTGTDGR